MRRGGGAPEEKRLFAVAHDAGTMAPISPETPMGRWSSPASDREWYRLAVRHDDETMVPASHEAPIGHRSSPGSDYE
jgi:hypothetical protein